MQILADILYENAWLNLTWMVLVIFKGSAETVCACVPPMLLLRLRRSRASITLLLLLSCGVAPPLTLSPCTFWANCLVFTLARPLLLCICICGTGVWLFWWCVTADICAACTAMLNWLWPCLRELIFWRASCIPPAPPLPRILKRASFCPSFSLASLTWNPKGEKKRHTF